MSVSSEKRKLGSSGAATSELLVHSLKPQELNAVRSQQVAADLGIPELRGSQNKKVQKETHDRDALSPEKSPEFRNPRPHSGLLALASGIPGVRGSKSGIPEKSPECT